MAINTKELLSLSVPYFIAVGACYLFGYWGAIGVNVLEFIGFADIVKLAVYPLVAGMIFTALGAVFSEITTGKHLPVGGGEHTPVGRFGRRFARPILAAALLGIFAIYIFAAEPFKWFAIAFLVMLFSAPLSHLEPIISALPNPKVRLLLLQVTLFLPTLAFAYGRMDIYLTTKLISAKTVDVARSKLPLASEAKFPVVYLGLLGTTFVLRETKSGQLVLVKQKDDSPLFLIVPSVGPNPSFNTGPPTQAGLTCTVDPTDSDS
jgi:hypothetical protein